MQFYRAFPIKLEETLSSADEDISNAHEELHTYKTQAKIISEEFRRITGYDQICLISQEKKCHHIGMRVLLA